MKVSFSVGEKSKKIVNTLKKSADDVDFYSYNSLQDLVKEARLRHLSFKRIIFSTTILKDAEKDLKELNDFIKNDSSSTEVVMIVMASDSGSDKVFNSIFNSPMYTPVILPKATSKNLLELVLNDILQLKTRYYVLDVKESENGGAENNAESAENLNTNSNSNQDTSEGGVPVLNLESDFATGPASVFTGFGGVSAPDTNVGVVDGRENVSVEPEVTSDGIAEFSEADSPSDDLDLSIGDYGSQHSDTGYLDEDEEEELKQFIKDQESKLGEEVQTIVESERVEPKVEEPTKRNIDLVIAVKGTGATQEIIDEAVKIVNEDDAKVLIIDLDNEENGVLSFVDTDKFYRENASWGISKQRLYEEDGVYIASNGYGILVNTKDLKRLLNSRILNDFDMIYIDCPAKSLSILDKQVVDMCNILIISKGDLSQLVSTSIALTDRSEVSLDVEKSIMSSCVIELVGDCDKKDVDYINNNFVFANGNWLDRLD